jgi:hypothetical protein
VKLDSPAVAGLSVRVFRLLQNRQVKRREVRVSDDDVLFGYRVRLFTPAAEIGVRAACRAMGVHHSTYYRWKRQVDRWGIEALRVRERRRPRMPLPVWVPLLAADF